MYDYIIELPDIL